MKYYAFIFSDERKYRFRRHLAFWGFWWLFQGFLYSFVAINSATEYCYRLPMSMLESLLYLTVHIFLSYTLIYFIIPRYLLKSRYLLTGVLTLSIFLLTAALSTTLTMFVINPLREYILGDLYNGPERITTILIFLGLMAGLRGAITIGGIAAAIKLMKTLYLKEQRNLQLQKENIGAQLQLLKAQIHPHFLFNTLNNIYSYTQDRAPMAGKLIAGLSDMLRFMLYESTQPLVKLSAELKMLRDYISLEKIRYGNKLDLHVDLPEHTGSLQIAPLLLLPLIENSFKHGSSNIIDEPWISLQISLEKDVMTMKLINGKAANSLARKEASGIGIKNVQQRLNMLYPDRHQFTITEETDVFIVNLKLVLEGTVYAQPPKSLSQTIAHV